MKNLIVANWRPAGKTSEHELRRLVEAQIENSLALGWQPGDLFVVTNLAFSSPATILRAPLNEHCLKGSKMFALEHLFRLGLIQEHEIWWAHDLDAWQNYWFDPPPFRDIGLAEYSFPRFNGGSVLLRATCCDLVQEITQLITRTNASREEPSINAVLRRPEHRPRASILNSTYNVGCTGFATRYLRSEQPILVSHFHPTSKRGWRAHVAGDNAAGRGSVCDRLTELLIRQFHQGKPPGASWFGKRAPASLGEAA